MSRIKNSKPKTLKQPIEKIIENDPGTMQHTVELPNESEESQAAPELEQLHLPDWSKINRLDPDSLLARWLLEHRSVIRELHHAYVTQVVFYTTPEGGQQINAVKSVRDSV